MKKKYTLKEVIESLPKNKKDVESFWAVIFARPASYVATTLLINLGCSANFVSLLSVGVVLAGCILMSINIKACVVIGVILINLWIVLDCCDGNIARATKTSSYMGEFMDAISGYSVCAFVLLGTGIAAYNFSSCLFGLNSIWNIIIGAVGCIADIYSRLIYQKYTNCCFVTECKAKGSTTYTPENYQLYDPSKRKGLTYIRLVVDRQLGIAGAFMPLIIASCVFDLFDILTLLYSLYHFVSLFAVLYIFSKKSIDKDKEMHVDYDID